MKRTLMTFDRNCAQINRAAAASPELRAPHDAPDAGKQTRTVVGSQRSGVRPKGTLILMFIVAVGAVVGLNHLVSEVISDPEKSEHAVNAEAMRTVGSEVISVWLPEALMDLARRTSEWQGLQTSEELQLLLELHHLQKAWYALTMRAYQAGGDISDLTVIRHPYTDVLFLPELRAVFATAVGTPPKSQRSDFSQAIVHVIPKQDSARQPAEVMAEFLRHAPQRPR